MKKKLILMLAAMTVALAQAQIDHPTFNKQQPETEAERAQKAAQAAAAAAAEARKKAVGDRTPVFTEEAMKIAEQQEQMKQRAKEKRERKLNKHGEKDSIGWAENQMKLHTWQRKWFVGGNLGVNFCFADNVTDHPPFRYFSDALGLGFEGYAGRYFGKKWGLRVGVGTHNVKNRVDRETVDEGWRPRLTKDGKHIYTDNGFFRFTAMELYADALFDVSGLASSNRFRPFHAHVIMGLGLISSSKKKLKDPGMLNTLPQTSDPDKEKDKFYIIDGEATGLKSFEGRVNPKSHVGPALRLGFMFDYRCSRHLSANLELTTTLTDDKFEGIKYDEPFDALIKLSGGLKYYF